MKFLVTEDGITKELDESWFDTLSVVDISLDNVSRFLKGKLSNNTYTTPLNIWGANRYTHYYSLRPTTSWQYSSINFKVNLSTNTPLSSNGLLNYLLLSPFHSDSTSSDRVFPANGTTNVNNGVATVVEGIYAYTNASTGVHLRAKLNYGTFTTIDVSTLQCDGIYDNAKDEWVNISNM